MTEDENPDADANADQDEDEDWGMLRIYAQYIQYSTYKHMIKNIRIELWR